MGMSFGLLPALIADHQHPFWSIKSFPVVKMLDCPRCCDFALLGQPDQVSDKLGQVRAAACRCVRSMSRSVVALHCSRVGADVAPPLFRRLQDSDPAIQASASATLCNVVLDTSPAQARPPALARASYAPLTAAMPVPRLTGLPD